MEYKPDIKPILTGFKTKKLNYDEALQRLNAFDKEALIWWILNNPFELPAFESKMPDLLSEHQKSLPKDNPHNNIRM